MTMRETKPLRNYASIGAGALILLLTAGSFVASLVLQKDLVFDDSFITYRYARNLAEGYGITWNPGERPVEGYTNFLLVLGLAPLIRLGVDPLAATRAMSVLAALAICGMLYRLARRSAGADRPAALMAVCAFLFVTPTAFLSMVGLETVLFTCALFGSFCAAHRWAASDRKADLALSNALGFVALLLRPEAVLLTTAIGIWALTRKRPTWGRLVPFVARHWGPWYVLPLLVYAAWKWVHFGGLLPNSFHIKAAGAGWLNYAGLGSVCAFLREQQVPIAFAAISVWVLRRSGERSLEWVAAALVGAYLAFYLHVETLMDIAGRFLYPLTPFVFYLALPAVVKLFEAVAAARIPVLLRAAAASAVFVLCFVPDPWDVYVGARRALRTTPTRTAGPQELMRQEYLMAHALEQYPKLRDVSMAFSDAGVIPYFTGVRFLDVVGLNDATIARERDLGRLVDYFFSWSPVLVLQPAHKDHRWLTDDHGPLGNYSQWIRDSRWDRYAYVGTVRTSGRGYDIHLLLRKDYGDFAAFAAFLRRNVVDTVYPVFPLPFGSYAPPSDAR